MELARTEKQPTTTMIWTCYPETISFLNSRYATRMPYTSIYE